MATTAIADITASLDAIKNQGLYKEERVITSPQGPEITVASGRSVINMCANNYLGLGNHPRLIAAAKKALDDHGFGMSSVRFHLRHPGPAQDARGHYQPLSGNRGHDSLLVLF